MGSAIGSDIWSVRSASQRNALQFWCPDANAKVSTLSLFSDDIVFCLMPPFQKRTLLCSPTVLLPPPQDLPIWNLHCNRRSLPTRRQALPSHPWGAGPRSNGEVMDGRHLECWHKSQKRRNLRRKKHAPELWDHHVGTCNCVQKDLQYGTTTQSPGNIHDIPVLDGLLNKWGDEEGHDLDRPAPADQGWRCVLGTIVGLLCWRSWFASIAWIQTQQPATKSEPSCQHRIPTLRRPLTANMASSTSTSSSWFSSDLQINLLFKGYDWWSSQQWDIQSVVLVDSQAIKTWHWILTFKSLIGLLPTRHSACTSIKHLMVSQRFTLNAFMKLSPLLEDIHSIFVKNLTFSCPLYPCDKNEDVLVAFPWLGNWSCLVVARL